MRVGLAGCLLIAFTLALAELAYGLSNNAPSGGGAQTCAGQFNQCMHDCGGGRLCAAYCWREYDSCVDFPENRTTTTRPNVPKGILKDPAGKGN
jgi:hypothetical protein